MGKLENLSKRDLVSYKRLAERIGKGFNDDFLDTYVPVLLRFISNIYHSDDSKIFELDDFIQECLIRINGLKNDRVDSLYNAGLVEASIYAVYKEMSSNISLKSTEPFYVGEAYEELEVQEQDVESIINATRVMAPYVDDTDRRITISEEEQKNIEIYHSFVLNELEKHPNKELKRIITSYWNGSLDYNSSYFDLVFEYFIFLKEKCKKTPNLSIFVNSVDRDINNILSKENKKSDVGKKKH